MAEERILSGQPTFKVVRTELVEEVQQTFNSWLSQVIRVYRDEQHVEFEWLVGSIPIDDGAGKEIVTRFSTDLKTKGLFYTDSNGREMLRRRRNARDTWNVAIYEPVAGNYYPVTTRIALEDGDRRMAVLNDRSQGGSSLVDGAVDLMIHRRLLHDDAFGVGEALNETAFGEGLIVRGHHYLSFGSKTRAQPAIEAQERFLQTKKLLPGWVFVSDATNLTYGDWREQYTNIVSIPMKHNLNKS